VTGAGDRARAYRLFAEALEHQGELREQFLLRECQGDAALRGEVDALLQLVLSDETATRALLALPTPREENLVGHICGRFRLVELIGEGGMGVVYRAERVDGVPQSVAVKVVSMDLAGVSQSRFEHEAQLLAALEHPAVARLIDAGVEGGRAWIAMEFVRGERIDRYCMARRLEPRDIVALMVQLADAVSVAHRMLVVHSDIKPANVLVTAEGVPKLIDFGIATALRDAATTADASLNAGRLFSPGFAAPEQISGGAITVATDVYGLGALAYRLLTGAPPFPDAHDPVAYMRAISASPVEMASRALLAASQDAALVRALRGDLDAILAKALQRDPAQRYATAPDMRADLQRYLERRPVLARRGSPVYRAGKFVRRHALAVSLSGLLVVSLICGGLLAGIQAHRASVARDEARTVTAFLTNDILAAANPMIAGTRDVQLRPLLDGATKTLQQRFAAQPTVLAELQAAMGTGYAALFDIEKAESLLTEAETGLARELGDANPETQKARMALWYLYLGNLDIKKLFKLSQRIASAESAAGRAASADALRARLMIAWIPCVEKAAAIVGLSNCGEVVRPFYLDARARFGTGALSSQEMAWFLGVALMYSAREDEAEPVLRDACAGLQHYYGPVHHRLTACRRYLAKALDANGKDEEAAAILQVVVQNFDKTLGPKSQFTAISEFELAGALLNGGHAAQAVPVARRALEAMEGNSDNASEDLWLTRMLLADALVQSQRTAEGLQLGERVLADALSTSGARSVTVLRLREHLAKAYVHAKDLQRAETLLLENLALGKDLPSRPAWFIGQLEASLAGALLEQDRGNEAKPLLQDAVAVLRKELGPNNYRTIQADAALRGL
jgi:predicted Ser/Thr protein kinase